MALPDISTVAQNSLHNRGPHQYRAEETTLGGWAGGNRTYRIYKDPATAKLTEAMADPIYAQDRGTYANAGLRDAAIPNPEAADITFVNGEVEIYNPAISDWVPTGSAAAPEFQGTHNFGGVPAVPTPTQIGQSWRASNVAGFAVPGIVGPDPVETNHLIYYLGPDLLPASVSNIANWRNEGIQSGVVLPPLALAAEAVTGTETAARLWSPEVDRAGQQGIRFAYPDAATRVLETGYAIGQADVDLGRVFRDIDTGNLFTPTAVGPTVWAQVSEVTGLPVVIPKNALVYPVGSFTAIAVNDSGEGNDGAVYKLPTVDALVVTLPNKADMDLANGIWRVRISGDWAALATQTTVLSFTDDTANGVEMADGLPDSGNEWVDLVLDLANDKWIATTGGDVTLTQVVPTYAEHAEVPTNVRLYLADGTGAAAEGLWRKETAGAPNFIG